MKGEEEAPRGIREAVLKICEKYISHGFVADLGCGYGYFLNIASKVGLKTIGVEINTRKIYERIQPIVRADLNNILPLKNEVFECVVAIEVIEHLENPWHFLREVKRILKNNGIAIFTFPNFTDLTSRVRFLFKAEFSFFIKKILEGGHISFVPYWLFKYMAKKEGFKILEIKGYRTWYERLFSKSIFYKLTTIFLLPIYGLLFISLSVFHCDSSSLKYEDYIFVLKSKK